MRTITPAASGGNKSAQRMRFQQRRKSCILCKTADRPGYSNHNLSECRFLPEADRRFMARSRRVGDADDDIEEREDDPDYDVEALDQELPSALVDIPSARRVNIVQVSQQQASS